MICDIEDLCSFVDIPDAPNYEILNVHPFTVRNKKTKYELKPSMQKSTGYYRYCLDKKQVRRHQLIAKLFIKNPHEHPCVDHSNRDKTDNSIRNLRWVSKSTNNRNLVKMKGDNYIWTTTPPTDLEQITQYNGWTFDTLYYSRTEDKFYTKVEDQYRELVVHINPKGGLKHVSIRATDSKTPKAIYFQKFHREYLK